jgi:hypothetical protein
MPERLPAAVERALRAGTATRLELAALTREEAGGSSVKRSANGCVDPPASGGSPFYARARPHARSSQAAPGPYRLSLCVVPVPPIVAASIPEEPAYRPAARMAQPVDTAIGHLGFRCIVRVASAS